MNIRKKLLSATAAIALALSAAPVQLSTVKAAGQAPSEAFSVEIGLVGNLFTVADSG